MFSYICGDSLGEGERTVESAATLDVLGYQRSQLKVTMKCCAHMWSQKIKELVHQPY